MVFLNMKVLWNMLHWQHLFFKSDIIVEPLQCIPVYICSLTIVNMMQQLRNSVKCVMFTSPFLLSVFPFSYFHQVLNNIHLFWWHLDSFTFLGQRLQSYIRCIAYFSFHGVLTNNLSVFYLTNVSQSDYWMVIKQVTSINFLVCINVGWLYKVY